VSDLHFVDPPECKDGLDGPRDLETRRRFNRFLMGALRQAWRVKRHALQTTDDLRPLIGRIQRLPVDDIITRVIDLVEDRNRRIVDIDCDTNSLVCQSSFIQLYFIKRRRKDDADFVTTTLVAHATTAPIIIEDCCPGGQIFKTS